MSLDYNFVYFGIIFTELQSFKVELSKLKKFSFLARFYNLWRFLNTHNSFVLSRIDLRFFPTFSLQFVDEFRL